MVRGRGAELSPDVAGAGIPGEGDFQLVGRRIPDFGDAPDRPVKLGTRSPTTGPVEIGRPLPPKPVSVGVVGDVTPWGVARPVPPDAEPDPEGIDIPPGQDMNSLGMWDGVGEGFGLGFGFGVGSG